MKEFWNRRDLVKAIGAGVLCAARPGWAAAGAARRRRADELEGLADRILATPRAQVFELVEPLLRRGLPWEDLEGAVFLAGIREVEPRPVGNKLHSVLAVESVYQLAAGGPASERGMAVLWSLDEIKSAQGRDARRGDWQLPARPDVSFSSREAAERELRAAFSAHDEERADRAVVGLLAFVGRSELFEVLWPFAMREHVGLCHRTIFAAHVDRILRRVGDQRLEGPARSLVYGLLEARPGPTVAEYEASRRIATTIREGWTRGEPAAEKSLEVARALQGASSAAARERFVAELNAGLDPASLWDALRLAAADFFARRPGLLVVHVTNALFHVYRATRSDATRRLALLQAASWMPLFRERFVRSRGMSMQACGLAGVLEETAGTSGRELADGHRAHLFRGVDENHQPKYAAAILEDAQLADPRWRRALLAPALAYLPTGQTLATALGARSRELVERLER